MCARLSETRSGAPAASQSPRCPNWVILQNWCSHHGPIDSTAAMKAPCGNSFFELKKTLDTHFLLRAQGPGLVNVLLALPPTATHSRPPLCGVRTRLLGWLQKNVHQSWLLALNRPRS